MKKYFMFLIAMLFVFVPVSLFADTGSANFFDGILDWFKTAWNWSPVVLMWLGGLVVAGTIIDKIVPDQYDKGFMSKLYNLPVIGLLLKSLVRFSPFSADVEQKK